MKGSPPPPPPPPFSMLETNKHPRGVCNIGWGKGGRITDEKVVFIQTQNIIVSLKALVSVKCLNTFSIYVNDLPLVPRSCLTESYVDDTKLYISFPGP